MRLVRGIYIKASMMYLPRLQSFLLLLILPILANLASLYLLEMPTLEPNIGSRVLVTGCNGFIGTWVVRILLEQGYRVLGAIRSLEKGKKLREYFASYGDKVEWIVVEDITKVRSNPLN